MSTRTPDKDDSAIKLRIFSPLLLLLVLVLGVCEKQRKFHPCLNTIHHQHATSDRHPSQTVSASISTAKPIKSMPMPQLEPADIDIDIDIGSYASPRAPPSPAPRGETPPDRAAPTSAASTPTPPPRSRPSSRRHYHHHPRRPHRRRCRRRQRHSCRPPLVSLNRAASGQTSTTTPTPGGQTRTMVMATTGPPLSPSSGATRARPSPRTTSSGQAFGFRFGLRFGLGTPFARAGAGWVRRGEERGGKGSSDCHKPSEKKRVVIYGMIWMATSHSTT